MNEGDQEVNGQLTSFDIEGALTGNAFLDALWNRMSKIRSLLTTEVCYNTPKREA